jgi:hypothetical protein
MVYPTRTAGAAPLIFVIAAPDKEWRHWPQVAGAVPGVLPLPVVGVRLALKQARGWRFG